MLTLNGSQVKLYHSYSHQSWPQPNSYIKQVLNIAHSGSVEKNGATETQLVYRTGYGLDIRGNVVQCQTCTRELSFCDCPDWLRKVTTSPHLVSRLKISAAILCNNIFKLQKRAIIIIMNADNRSRRELFKKLNILPLYSQYILSLLLFVVKIRM